MTHTIWQPPPSDDQWRDLLACDNPVIVEVGAHDGTDTARFLEMCSCSEVHCFEPDPRAIKRWRKRHDANRRAVLHEVAVAECSGWQPWFASHGKVPTSCPVDNEALRDWDLSGSIRKPTGHLGRPKWCTFTQEGAVRCTSLNDWKMQEPASGIPTIDLMWIDVQGAEDAVLRGASDVLRRVRFLYTEFYDEVFNEQGFECPNLYEDQAGIAELLGILGQSSEWRLRGFYQGGNVLVENKWPMR